MNLREVEMVKSKIVLLLDLCIGMQYVCFDDTFTDCVNLLLEN